LLVAQLLQLLCAACSMIIVHQAKVASPSPPNIYFSLLLSSSLPSLLLLPSVLRPTIHNRFICFFISSFLSCTTLYASSQSPDPSSPYMFYYPLSPYSPLFLIRPSLCSPTQPFIRHLVYKCYKCNLTSLLRWARNKSFTYPRWLLFADSGCTWNVLHDRF
jgi:hypothetical protein